MERPGNIRLCYKEYTQRLNSNSCWVRKMNVCIINNSETSIKRDINHEVCDCVCVVFLLTLNCPKRFETQFGTRAQALMFISFSTRLLSNNLNIDLGFKSWFRGGMNDIK